MSDSKELHEKNRLGEIMKQHGTTYQELADNLDVSESTVKS